MKDVAKWVHTVGRSRRAKRARRKLSAPHATDGHGLVHELSDFTPHPRISVMGGASGRRGRMKFGLFVKRVAVAAQADVHATIFFVSLHMFRALVCSFGGAKQYSYAFPPTPQHPCSKKKT